MLWYIIFYCVIIYWLVFVYSIFFEKYIMGIDKKGREISCLVIYEGKKKKMSK